MYLVARLEGKLLHHVHKQILVITVNDKDGLWHPISPQRSLCNEIRCTLHLVFCLSYCYKQCQEMIHGFEEVCEVFACATASLDS